jgi:hypothetical protein
MLMNISYINMCKLNKNRERRKEWEREEVVVMVCVVVNLVNHLNEKKPFRPLYIFKQMLENNFVLFIWKNRIYEMRTNTVDINISDHDVFLD